MTFLGLHWIDIVIVLGVLITMLVIAARLSRAAKREADFFVGGRKLGSVLQFFLNFGMMADSNEASIIATEVYRQGTAGMWIGFQALFATPFFWFTPVWFRRTRLITYADLFKDRFNSRSLSIAHAGINVIVLIMTLSLGNLISYKMTAAMLAKPASEYTAKEREIISDFTEYVVLREAFAAGTLPAGQQERFDVLKNLADRGEIASYISYIRPLPFYVCYSLIVCSYLLAGGLTTVAILDGLQGLFIIVISFILLPFGLARIGGISGLHHAVPADMLQLFGVVEHSDYTWFSILAIVLNCIVVVPSSGGPGNASGKNERAIRVGTLTAAFSKRLVMIAWMLAGLMAVALFGHGLSDPDNSWGMLSSRLLPVGFMGVMVVGMVIGHMPNVGFTAINISALFTRNLYEPAFPNRSQAHYVGVAKAAIVLILAISAGIATLFTGVISILTATLTFASFFGATGYLIYFYRKLTAGAIWISMVIWIVVIGLLPWLLPQFHGFRTNPAVLAELRAGSASGAVAGSTQLPAALFFDHVARANPRDPASPCEGMGRFNIENYVLWQLGLPLQRFSAAGLLASRWYFDSVFPFLMLILFSQLSALIGRRDPVALEAQRIRNNRFFAKLRTPIGGTPEEDERHVMKAQEDPTISQSQKLLPGTNWEFSKWTRQDAAGFLFCWAVVGCILCFLCLLLRW